MSVCFCELFGGVCDPDLRETLKDTEITACVPDMERRSLTVQFFSNTYIPQKTVHELEAVLKTRLKLDEISVLFTFAKDALNAEALADVGERIKFKNPRINGYLNGAEYILLNENEAAVKLQFGGLEVLNEIKFSGLFEAEINREFSRNITLSFTGVLNADEAEIPLPEAPPEEPVSRPAPKKPSGAKAPEIKKMTFDYKPKDGLPVYLESAQLFYGRALNKNVKPIISIVPPAGANESVPISAWGEVFGLEKREIKTKRGPMYVVKFAFSDRTNSLFANFFLDVKLIDTIKPLKDGAFVLVNGDYSYDKWSGDFIVSVKSLALLQNYEETDDYEGEKRVELHCHTNMSAKDAVSSASDLINRAYKWGHKAIAITDHGVVQAYPEAASAVKKIRKGGGDFKVIYGVEAYFADDTQGETDLTKLPRYHQIILVKNLVGLKNLYKIVSSAHLDNFYKRPISLRSVIEANREGLIIGSACEQGELYKAIVEGKPKEELVRIAKFYDYLEIQPLGNNEFMVRESAMVRRDRKGNIKENPFKHVTGLSVIMDFNRQVVALADELNLPVVATGDVHFASKDDEIIRKILMAGQDYEDFDNQAPLYLKTTKEMLEDFSYFGDRAKEFVIDNPNKIAEMISDDVIPVPDGNYPPVIEGSDDLLRDICWKNAMDKYGFEGKIPEIVSARLEKELNSIINNGFSIMYVSAQKLVSYSEEHGYLVGSRGSVGSSFAATMAGISEVNPLMPHYYCKKCKYSEFFTNGEVGSGFDLPEKNCPHCGTPLSRDGHDIPFETFLGFKGDKVPDIDLNFSDEFQSEVQKYTESLFGSENVFKAGTISTVAEKTAFGFSKAYAEKKGIVLSSAELNRLAGKVEKAKIKQTTGQHPAGMIVVPRDKTIYDFCPVQHPADDVNSDIVTTHFDFHSIHDTILKLDELGHVVPTMYKYLEEYSGIPVSDISMSDEKVYTLFTSPEALGVTEEQIFSKTGTFCLPEFGTDFVRGMLTDCKPKNFSDLLQISGLSHGTDVYLGNAKDLIDKGICTISEVIGTRDNIMVYLIYKGLDSSRAFKITETVRKGMVASGKVSKEDWASMEEDMRKVGVPDWYIESCGKIKYMFPKAHAAAYVISALRVAWYKVYRPLEFYCAYFTARPEDVDVPTILKGKAAVKNYLEMIKQKGKEATKKELDVYENMLIFNEIMERGIEVLPIDIKKSHAVKYVPEDGKIRLPFGALGGVGEKAAWQIYNAAQKGDFISKEEFQVEAGVSKTVMAALSDLGALGELPDTNQISMF
ncbi:MAG: PolC-type DNA polymerase III [Ruminococcaceae bacterium]|nr:PolC-type DNA polymerase III [Oscillospiraceae bacterium]